MNIDLREWNTEDAPDLVVAINNKKVLDNLRDGIPYPYTSVIDGHGCVTVNSSPYAVEIYELSWGRFETTESCRFQQFPIMSGLSPAVLLVYLC